MNREKSLSIASATAHFSASVGILRGRAMAELMEGPTKFVQLKNCLDLLNSSSFSNTSICICNDLCCLCRYYFGIIDILQSWNSGKILERFAKKYFGFKVGRVSIQSRQIKLPYQ